MAVRTVSLSSNKTLISTPPTGATGPYIYECDSSSQSSFGYVEHEWSPAPMWGSPSGTVARFSFPDDNEYSIHLSVTDAMGCRAFKTHKVGNYEFLVSTDPTGANGATGTVTGTRDGMEFSVVVKAEITGNFIGVPPAQVTLEFSRVANNSEGTVVGTLVAGSIPPRYEFGWSVRQEKGRWGIKLRDYRSNTVNFKIDKRKQIVEVANSWSTATQAELTAADAVVCNQLTAKIYNRVGLPLSDTLTPQYNSATLPCSGDGCLLFYAEAFKADWDVAHIAVKADGQRVNVNSATKRFPEFGASKEAENAGVPDDYKTEVRSASTVNLDEE